MDLTGSALQRKAPVNSRTLAGPRVAYKAITMPFDPVNEGSFAGLNIEIQEGNMMMAQYPAPMASWSRPIPSLVDTVLLALAPVLPDKIPAGHLGVLGGTVVFFGDDPRTGERFVTQSIEGGGWGGRPWEDGESASVSVCQGDVRNAPIEKMELKWPVLVLGRELRQDSGGAGKYRGGLGLATKVRGLVEGRWTLADTGRKDFPPLGLFGGKPGAASDSLLRLTEEPDFKKVDIVRHWVPESAEAIIATAGGGGWGDPLERDPEKVRWDVIEDYVSLEEGRNQYGVVLDPETLEIDFEGTTKLREERRRREA